MKSLLSRAVLALTVAATLALSDARGVTIDWVPVGDAGNTADGATGYGAVADAFQMGKYEVTIQQYTDFLNAVAASDPYSLYNDSMATTPNIAGISRSGTSGGYSYSVTGPSGATPAGASSPGNRPITYVSWFDAARFANWMQNGQGSGDTETGAYTLNGATSGGAPAVNSGAQFFVPTLDQWYKAAYYKGSGTSAGYWSYATQSDAVPGNVIGSGANQANYYDGTDLSVTQSGAFDSNQNYLSDVGAFSNSASAYGTFDQSGNVWEWNDLDGLSAGQRGIRGGYWNAGQSSLVSTFGITMVETYEGDDLGFRLASPVAVPEPSTCVIALAGLACGGYSLFRGRTRA